MWHFQRSCMMKVYDRPLFLTSGLPSFARIFHPYVFLVYFRSRHVRTPLIIVVRKVYIYINSTAPSDIRWPDGKKFHGIKIEAKPCRYISPSQFMCLSRRADHQHGSRVLC